MKELIIVACLLCFTVLTPAQIVKEHSFEDQASVNIQQVKLDVSGKKYCLVNCLDSISYAFKFINNDYSSFKTVTINLDSLFTTAHYKEPALKVRYASEHLFDTNDDIDLLAELSYLDNNDDLYAQVLIFHGDGSVLFASDINNSNAWLVNQSMANAPMAASIINTTAGTKLILDAYYFNEGIYRYDVYPLPGTIPVNLNSLKSGDTDAGLLEAFPNPASEYVNLRYSLPEGQNSGIIEITDNQGRTVSSLRVNGRQGVLRVRVDDLKNGLYYYKVNNRRGLPRSGKFVIAK